MLLRANHQQQTRWREETRDRAFQARTGGPEKASCHSRPGLEVRAGGTRRRRARGRVLQGALVLGAAVCGRGPSAQRSGGGHRREWARRASASARRFRCPQRTCSSLGATASLCAALRCRRRSRSPRARGAAVFCRGSRGGACRARQPAGANSLASAGLGWIVCAAPASLAFSPAYSVLNPTWAHAHRRDHICNIYFM